MYSTDPAIAATASCVPDFAALKARASIAVLDEDPRIEHLEKLHASNLSRAKHLRQYATHAASVLSDHPEIARGAVLAAEVLESVARGIAAEIGQIEASARRADRAERPDLIGAVLDAGVALAQEMQDIVDEAVQSAGGEDPVIGTATACALELVETWERAYSAYNARNTPAVERAA